MKPGKKNHALEFPFIVVWEFRVRSGRRRAFEKAYGPEGDWARLFRRDQEYLGTELIVNEEGPLRYLTLDFWTSRRAHRRFLKHHQAAYERLNGQCELLTLKEKLIGEFDHLGGEPAWAQTRKSHAGTVKLRPATASDIPRMMALERNLVSAARWSEATYRGIFAQGSRASIACVAESPVCGVAGFFIARLTGDECDLENLVVDAEQQSRGWGKRLIDELVSQARARGAKCINLEVRESSRRARSLYEKSGFAVSGRRRSYYRNPPDDALLYRREL